MRRFPRSHRISNRIGQRISHPVSVLARRMPRLPSALPGLLIGAVCVSALSARATELTVTIADVRSTDGTLLVQVFDGEEGFAGRAEPVGQYMLEPQAPEVTFEVELPPGTYGMRVMQDLDDDMEMDTNLIGIPTEPWGFSNDAVGNFGPPGWDAVTFELGEGAATHSVRLVH